MTYDLSHIMTTAWKNHLRIEPTEKVVYKKFQDYAKRPCR